MEVNLTGRMPVPGGDAMRPAADASRGAGAAAAGAHGAPPGFSGATRVARGAPSVAELVRIAGEEAVDDEALRRDDDLGRLAARAFDAATAAAALPPLGIENAI